MDLQALVSDLLPEVIFEFHSALATQFDHELPVAGLHLLLVLIMVPLLSLNLLVGLVPGQSRAAMNNTLPSPMCSSAHQHHRERLADRIVLLTYRISLRYDSVSLASAIHFGDDGETIRMTVRSSSLRPA